MDVLILSIIPSCILIIGIIYICTTLSEMKEYMRRINRSLEEIKEKKK